MAFENHPQATATFGPYTVDHPAEVVYSAGFEASADSWTFASPSTAAVRALPASYPTVAGINTHSGAYFLAVTSATPYTTKAVRTLTGLVIGRSYTVTAWAGRNNNGKSASIGVTGIGTGTVVTGWTASTWAWKLCTYTFTATATSHELVLNGTLSGGTGSVAPDFWDDITVTKNAWTETVASAALPLSDGDVTLDAGTAPYGLGLVTVPLDATLLERMDANAFPPQRVQLSASVTDGSPRAFDLALTNRKANHKARTVTVDLATDEYLAQSYADVVENYAREYETSARSIVNFVLNKVSPGMALQPGVKDADLTACWLLTNLCTNPSAEATTGYVLGTNAGSLGVGTSSPFHGAGYVRWVGVAAGTTFLAVPISDTRVTAGQTFTFNAYLRASAASQQGRLYVQFKDSAGNVIGDGALSPLGTLATGTAWSEHSWTFTVPEGVVSAQPYVVGSGAAGTTYAVDGVSYYEDDEFVDFFTGSSTSPLYTYQWGGVVGASPSTRTPVAERRPEMYIWPAGMTAWDFLQPLLGAAKLRLFCDEQRRWYLIDPTDYTAPGTITTNLGTTSDGTDEMGGLRGEYATGVVVRYSWTDVNGKSRTKDDRAGVAGRVHLREESRPYPGPGMAQAILNKMQNQGRAQTVTVATDYTATPGMAVATTLPATADQIGRLTSVKFLLSQGLMEVNTSALEEAP